MKHQLIHPVCFGRTVRNLACCGSLLTLGTSADAGNRRLSYSYETTTMAAGAMELESCATCHVFVDPAGHSSTELRERILPEMGRKAGLSGAERQAVLDYLLTIRKP